MKRILYSIFTLMFLATSCDKDGEMLKVTEPGAPSDFSASPTEVVLTSDGTDVLALSLVWTAGALPEVSDPTVALPDDLTEESIQFSSTEDFASYSEIFLEKGQTSLQFTGGELSKLLMKFGMTEVQQYSLYTRLAVKMGTKYTYGTTVVIKVTPYAVETGWMKVVDKADNTKVVATLYSNDDPEVFEGFAVVASWYNFFFLAADGIIWGCDADWTIYSAVYNSSNNLWFAAPAGCQWVTVDTAEECWSQVSIPSVDAVIDGSATVLKFSQSTGEFKGTITTATGNASVTVSGMGTLYDKTTGDASGVDNPFCFAFSADGTFDYVNAAGTSEALVVENAGTYTLTLNVNECRWTLESGAEAPPTVSYPENVAIYYYIKEASTKLALATEMAETDDDGIFEGFVWTDPEWGTDFSNYRFHADDKVYSCNDAERQYVLAELGWNCWSGNPGMNYVVADFTTMTWTETKVTKIAVTGDFNSWSLDTDQLTFNMSTGKWEAECDINTIGYGFKFVLDDEAGTWRWMYADADLDGVLNICGSNDNIVPSATGRYKIELDLSSFTSPTYTMTPLD